MIEGWTSKDKKKENKRCDKVLCSGFLLFFASLLFVVFTHSIACSECFEMHGRNGSRSNPAMVTGANTVTGWQQLGRCMQRRK